MPYFKITTDKKGNLKARIQVSGKDVETGKSKIFVRMIYNRQELSLAKFKKQVEREALDFSDEVARAYERGQNAKRYKVLSFHDLANEWVDNVKKNLSINYHRRAVDTTKKFNEYLQERGLLHCPITEITVRDIELFFRQYTLKGKDALPVVKMKKELPENVNFRALARDGIITRCTSYGMKHKGNNILEMSARQICDLYKLQFDEYFSLQTIQEGYSIETVRGHRRILRAIFNEALRYDWIVKNPVCATKIGGSSNNTSLREVPEKEVFSLAETKEFLKVLNNMPEELIYKVMPFKIMLLTGVRTAEMCGLRWSDIDFEHAVIHIRRNRLSATEVGGYEKEPKTKSSIRDIPLAESLVNDLKNYYQWFDVAIPDFSNKLDEYYLASNIYRGPLYPGVLKGWLKEIELANGFKEVTCHGLRHTYCSILLSQNVPIQTVSKYMGHSDSTITLKVYSHFIPDTQDRALDALDMVLTM